MSTPKMRLPTAGLALVLALPLAAQTPPAPAAQPAAPPIGVERVLGMRAQLGLSAQQIEQLESIRKSALETRKARMSEMLDLRSRLAAGDITHDQLRAEMQSRRDAMRAEIPRGGDRVRQVLTDAQREKLQTLRRQNLRRFLAYRGRSFRGEGRGGSGFRWRGDGRPGFRGDRFGPSGPPAFQRGLGGRGFGPGRGRADGPRGGMWRRGPNAGPLNPRFNRTRPAPDSTRGGPPDEGR